MNRAQRFAKEEGGQVAILVALFFTMLLSVTAVVVNTGQLYVSRRSAQAAVDAAALAGAFAFALNSDQTQATTAATNAASLNGFAAGGGTTVTVSFPGSINGATSTVQVDITAPVTSTLMPQWGSTNVHASGVAGAGAPASTAIIALGSTGTALSVGSQGKLTMYSIDAPTNNPDCSTVALPTSGTCASFGGKAWDDSADCPSAASNLGSSNIGPSTASLNVVGCASGSWPNPNPSSSAIPDPYASFPKPPRPSPDLATPGNCRQQFGPDAICYMQPGAYTQDWTMNANNAEYALCPGIYVFAGSSVSVSGGGGPSGTNMTTLAGSDSHCNSSSPAGVLLFFTDDNYPSAPTTGSKCASGNKVAFSVSGNGTVTLSPQTSGQYAGMLIFIDPTCDGSSTKLTANVTIGGNGTFTTTGLVYDKTGTVSLNGVGSGDPVKLVSGIVAQTVAIQNASVIAIVAARAAGAATSTRLVQ